LNVRGVIDSPLPEALAAPLYAKAGDWMLVLVLVLFASLAGVLSKKGSLSRP
jgi:apolipoprotein N-acyltransferase